MFYVLRVIWRIYFRPPENSFRNHTKGKTTLRACHPVHDENGRKMKLLTTSPQLAGRALSWLEGEFVCLADATSSLHYHKQCQNGSNRDRQARESLKEKRV